MINALYFSYVFKWDQQARFGSPDEFKFWGAVLLTLIVVSIVARIIIFIVFAIINTIATREEMPKIEDELDKLIELKSTRNSMVIFGIGFVSALVTLVLDMPPTNMFVVMVFAGILSEVTSSLSSLYYYRRGV